MEKSHETDVKIQKFFGLFLLANKEIRFLLFKTNLHVVKITLNNQFNLSSISMTKLNLKLKC